jgi:large subunit ribosomal protein L6
MKHPIDQAEKDTIMSRIGRKPVPVPPTVKVSIADSTIEVEGPKGKLSFKHRPEIDVAFDKAVGQILVSRHDDERTNRSLHGLTRSLVANMVQGVTTGYTKKLEIVGVGYQAQSKKANTLTLQVGYANQIVLEAPPGVTVTVADPTHVTISGPDWRSFAARNTFMPRWSTTSLAQPWCRRARWTRRSRHSSSMAATRRLPL